MYLIKLEGIEAASGTNSKLEWLTIVLDDPDMHLILDATFNFARKYFIKQIPELSEEIPCIGGHLPEFMTLLGRLEKREITGDAARLAVKELLDRCTSLERKWFTRILLKDLRCGVGLTLVNKAGFKIPEFDVMLAKDGKKCKKINGIIKKGVFVSKKLDGYRCLAIVEDDKATLYSRNGSEYTNFASIQEALVSACASTPNTTRIFDGEIMSDDFSSMQKSAFASKRGTTVGDVVYHVFDCIPADEWQSQSFNLAARDRYANLDAFFDTLDSAYADRLVKVEHKWTTSRQEVDDLEKQYIADGYEGAMILPNIPYYLGRKTNAMMKFKTMESMDCKILSVYEGEGKYVGSLGGFRVLQENGIECGVGSGFTDQERQAIFADPSSVIGRVIEIKYQNLSDDGVMRFPIILRFRDDK
jgi:DNA ligase 1